MNHKRLILLTICCILAVIAGLSALSFAGDESEVNAKAEQHFEKANELYDTADYDGAIAEYEKITRLSPNSKIAQNAQYWMGQSYYKAGQYDAALAAFQGLVDEYPASAIVSSTQLMIGRVEQSREEKALVEAIEKDDLDQLKLLISKGADVNARVKAKVTTWDGEATFVGEGWTLLNLAIFQQHVDTASFLIDNGADVNGRDEFDNHKVPLHYVAHRGSAALAKLLIAKGADVNVREDGGYTPLYNVSSDNNPDRNDQLEVAKLLISNGADIEASTDWHVTPLFNAAQKSRVDMVELLLSKGANTEARDRRKQTPLHAAVISEPWSKTTETSNERLEIAKLLLDKGAYIDSKDDVDATPLSYAIVKGNEDMVELLLARGAARWRRYRGLDYMGIAMYANQKKMVKFLIDKGFDYSPVHVAAFFGDLDKVKSYLAGGGDIDAQGPSSLPLLGCAIAGESTEVAKFLIIEGADIRPRISRKGSVLLWTVRTGGSEGQPEIVRMLLDKGVDVTIRDDCGRTALLWAAHRGQKDVVEMILAKGADVNAKSDYSCYIWIEEVTALHEVCLDGNAAVAEVLIAHGADVNAKTRNGKTPMDLAKSRGRKQLVELLRKHEAKE